MHNFVEKFSPTFSFIKNIIVEGEKIVIVLVFGENLIKDFLHYGH